MLQSRNGLSVVRDSGKPKEIQFRSVFVWFAAFLRYRGRLAHSMNGWVCAECASISAADAQRMLRRKISKASKPNNPHRFVGETGEFEEPVAAARAVRYRRRPECRRKHSSIVSPACLLKPGGRSPDSAVLSPDKNGGCRGRLNQKIKKSSPQMIRTA
jgi:hypothetical protein